MRPKHFTVLFGCVAIGLALLCLASTTNTFYSAGDYPTVRTVGTNDMVLGQTNFATQATMRNISVYTLLNSRLPITASSLSASNVVVMGTTNQVKFGATNTAPASPSAPTKWISVQVDGEATVYRLPLYE